MTQYLDPYWKITRGNSPIIATAIHEGHFIRPQLRPYLAVDNEAQRRGEDPMTGLWADVADNSFVNHRSRFEVDFDRPRGEVFCEELPNTQRGAGHIWRQFPPAAGTDQLLTLYDHFFALMAEWLERLIAQHGNVLLLDIHSYNHRLGAFREPGIQRDNPDIDVNSSNMDRRKFSNVLEVLLEALASGEDSLPAGVQSPALFPVYDVRENVRDGRGRCWPEWVFERYGDRVCTITLNYKKNYMDEWTGSVVLAEVDRRRQYLSYGLLRARRELMQC